MKNDKQNRAWIETHGTDSRGNKQLYFCYRNPDNTITKVKTKQSQKLPQKV